MLDGAGNKSLKLCSSCTDVHLIHLDIFLGSGQVKFGDGRPCLSDGPQVSAKLPVQGLHFGLQGSKHQYPTDQLVVFINSNISVSSGRNKVTVSKY